MLRLSLFCRRGQFGWFTWALTLFLAGPFLGAAAAEDVIPQNAVAFVRIQVAEIVRQPSLKEYRQLWEKAGPKALAALDSQFIPTLSSLDQITAVLLPITDGKPEDSFYFVLEFSQPFDVAAALKANLPDGKPAKNNPKVRLSDLPGGAALYAPNDRTLILGSSALVPKIATLSGGSSPMRAAVQAEVDAGAFVYGAVNLAGLPLPPDLFEQLPEEFQPLVKMNSLAFALRSKMEQPTLVLRASYANGEKATQAERALLALANIGRGFLAGPRREAEQQLFGTAPPPGTYKSVEELPNAIAAVGQLAGINFLDELLAKPPIEKQDRTLVLQASFPAWSTPYVSLAGLSIGFVLPAVQKVREAAARAQSQNNLKQIGLAMHSYNDVHGHLPPVAIKSKTGQRLLSWRVEILPYLEQQALYKEFKLDEPWDSEHNKKLIPRMPNIYRDPRSTDVDPRLTTYKVFTGKDTIFPPQKSLSFNQIADGSSNTILAVSAGPGVIWTKPEDFEFDANKPVPNLLAMPALNPIMTLMADGSVRAIYPTKLDPKTWKNLIMAADGNTIDLP